MWIYHFSPDECTIRRWTPLWSFGWSAPVPGVEMNFILLRDCVNRLVGFSDILSGRKWSTWTYCSLSEGPFSLPAPMKSLIPVLMMSIFVPHLNHCSIFVFGSWVATAGFLTCSVLLKGFFSLHLNRKPLAVQWILAQTARFTLQCFHAHSVCPWRHNLVYNKHVTTLSSSASPHINRTIIPGPVLVLPLCVKSRCPCLINCVMDRKAPFFKFHVVVSYVQLFSVHWRQQFAGDWIVSIVHCLLCCLLFLSRRQVKEGCWLTGKRPHNLRVGESLHCWDAACSRYLFKCPSCQSANLDFKDVSRCFERVKFRFLSKELDGITETRVGLQSSRNLD